MKIVYPWLKEFVDITAAPADLRERLSLAGVAIDSIEETSAGPVLDAEITANRPDCLGHYGMARETAAIYRVPVKGVKPKLAESDTKVSDATRVEIEAPDLCVRYTARVMRGVKIQPSPEWLRQRLEAIGENSINNVVDVTNYVMFELGQPLHAFDLDKLQEKRIVVRRARPGEKLKTLDGSERTLTKDICVIADAEKAIAIGGIMGGANSEIEPTSENILLEAACFNPISIRRTSKAQNLRTEASYRFERGVDPNLAELASRRAVELIQQVAGGEVLTGAMDIYPQPPAPAKIRLTRKELLRVMGADIPDRDIEEILTALGFQPSRIGSASKADSPDATWDCAQPSWRADVSREVDLIEEVARHFGYEKFPPRLPPAKQAACRLPHAKAHERLRECIIGLGYQEVIDIPLVDAKRDVLFRPENLAPAVIGNPLAEDASVMRSNGIVSMLGTLEWNLNHGQRNLKLFEIGKTYQLRDGEPVETHILTLGATGFAREKTIYEQPREFSFVDLKGDLDRLGELAGGLMWKPGTSSWLNGAREAEISLACRRDGNGTNAPLGVAGQLANRIADQFKLRQNIFIAELWLDPLLTAVDEYRAGLRFKPLPKFPSVSRDFSLVLSDGVAFSQVVDSIRTLQISELESVEAADLFRGGQVPAGKFSLMIRVTFQSMQATLTEPQLTDFSTRIVGALEQRLGATLRAG